MTPLLPTEQPHPGHAGLGQYDTATLVGAFVADQALAAQAVQAAAPALAQAVDAAVPRIRAGGRLLYAGAGTSGRLGTLDAVECPPTFGSPPDMVVGIIAGGAAALLRAVEGAEDDVNAGITEMDARRVSPADVVVGIAASGVTPFVRAALGRAQPHSSAL